MTRVDELGGTRLVSAGQKELNAILEIPPGHHAVWLIDGRAEWQPESGNAGILEPSQKVWDLDGPGSLRFLETSHYARFEAWDELGFGPRAILYRTLVESRNRGIGEALAAGLPPQAGQIWADVGTGTGAMVQALQAQEQSRRPQWILGIDRASRMLDEAWSHSSAPIPAWFVARDLMSVQWPQRTFDGITALLLLHLIDDLDYFLGNLFGALKPGGIFAYAVSADANPFMRMIMHQLAGPGDFFKQGQKKIRQSVLGAGFTIQHSATYKDEIVMESPDAMRELIRSIGGPASRGLRADVSPPGSIERVFELVWAQKPGRSTEARHNG